MMKKVLFLMLGFGMITAGIAGITTSFVDRKNEVALKQFEKAQEEARTAAAEDQRKIEEKRQEIDKLAIRVKEERQRIEEAHRRADEARRLREAANQEQKRASAAAPAISSKGPAKGKPSETDKKRSVLSRKQQEPAKGRASESGSRGSMTAKASKHNPPDEAVKQISRKASLEAARLFERVEYFNRETGELILAEPIDAGPGSVRVRIRIWRHNRLVKDDLIRVSEDASRRSPRHRA
jgi:hypothetical protein